MYKKVGFSMVVTTIALGFFYHVVSAQGTMQGECKADINQDGLIDISDYGILASNFSSTSPTNPRADLNSDGVVDITDYGILAINFLKGASCTSLSPSSSTAPTSTTTPTTTIGSNAHAMGLWTPTKWDTCTNATDTARIKEIHDAYKVKGPDGKWYPTWHPPVDPSTGCKFGHEHGLDPKQSPFWSKIQQTYGFDANGNGTVDGDELTTAGLPFGYVNEQFAAYNAAQGKASLMRHEDHVGHKLDWKANVSVDYSPANSPVGGQSRIATGVRCDYLTKAHQGTHSKDAFSNNLHEVISLVSCSDGQDLRIAKLVQFGKAGEFTRLCDVNGQRNNSTITTGFANSSTDYLSAPANDGSSRQIIDRACIEQAFLVPEGKFSGNMYEAWSFNMNLKKKSGQMLVTTLDQLLDVEDAARYYDPAKPNSLGYAMDLCYEVLPDGRKWRGGGCDTATNYGKIKGITWDDPRSAFRGLHRGFYFKPGDVSNQGGPTAWYTDPYGYNGQTTPFVGSIKQYVVSRSVNYGQKFGGPIEPSNVDRVHKGTGVHTPN